MTDDEVVDKVLRIVSEGGYSSIARLVREVPVETLRDIYSFEDDENDDE